MTLYEYVRQNNRVDLLLEWDREANAALDPNELTPSSSQAVGWVCGKGHRWKAAINARTLRGTGCPYCAGQSVIPGRTDLETLRPDVMRLWDKERNSLSPAELSPGSHKRCVWRCERGHRWEATVYSVTAGSGCPYCAGNKAIPDETDLATTHPRLAAEWDEKSNKKSVKQVSRGSMEKAWWICPQGHSYEAAVYSRVAGTGCPYCAGKKVLAGFNDLATTDPELLKNWDYEKNDIKPEEINRGSHKKVWWRCALGHSYEAAVYSHAAGADCPYCTGRKVLVGFNDLATTHPKVAAEWDTELNGSLEPEMVTKGSNKKVWWQCAEGHVWQATIFSRTRTRAAGCPVCAGTAKPRRRSRFRPQPERPRIPALPLSAAANAS